MTSEVPTEAPEPATAPSETRPMIDEKLFKAYELYLSERTRLSTGKQEQAKSYDQTILTYSAGAVALSITFLEKVVRDPDAKSWLYTSWILFALAMMSTLYSFLASQKAFEGEIAVLDTRYRQLIGLPPEDTVSPRSPRTAWGVTLTWLQTFAAVFTPALDFFRATVRWLNRLAGLLFFFGVICFCWFALQNWVLLKKETAMATTKIPGAGLPPQPPTKIPLGAQPDSGVLPPIKHPQSNSSPAPQPKGNKQ